MYKTPLAIVGALLLATHAFGGSVIELAPAMKKLTLAKSSLGVEISYSLSQTAVGMPSTLNLTATGGGRAEPVTLTVRPDTQLDVASTSLVIGAPYALASSNSFDITVTPRSAGLHYVNVFLRSGSRARAVGIPVQVGGSAEVGERKAQIQRSPGGPTVISVPANR